MRPKSAVEPFLERQTSLFHTQALRVWETHKQIAKISVMELMSTVLEVVCEGDLFALNGFLESDMICKGHFTAEQIRALCKLCWQVREGYSPAGRELLGIMMERLQSAYPTLCGYPEEIGISDQEEE